MPQTMTDPVLMPPGAAEAAFGPVAAGLGPARRGGTAARQGRAGGDGDALAVMEQLERLSVDELVGRGVGAHVDAQPPVAVEESEGEPGQSRPESRGERQRITARWHHDVPVRPGRRPHPDGEDPRPPRLHAGQRVLEDGRLGRLGAEHPRAGEEGVGRRLAGEVLALGDDAVDARLEEVVIPAARVGLLNPVIADVAVSVVPKQQSGMAAGINDAFRQVGVAVGIAIWGAIFVGRGADKVAELAAGTPPQAVSARASSSRPPRRANCTEPSSRSPRTRERSSQTRPARGCSPGSTTC